MCRDSTVGSPSSARAGLSPHAAGEKAKKAVIRPTRSEIGHMGTCFDPDARKYALGIENSPVLVMRL
jgi:hypothetical protein